ARRWYPGELLGLRPASFLRAEGVELRGEGLDDSMHDRLLEVTDLEREGSTPGNDVHPARLELHHADVGHRIRVDSLDQFAKTRGRPGGNAAGVVAQSEGRRARVVLGSDHAHLLPVDANDPGHDRQLDAV